MKTWHFVEIKAQLPDGAWMHEPDKAQWIDEKTGLDCLIVRGGSGALCGYVGVPESHKAYSVDYDDCSLESITVHGGLTFAGLCQENNPHGVCHSGVVANEKVWWLGFDCAHFGDSCPSHGSFSKYETYKDFDYVKAEATSLARQLA